MIVADFSYNGQSLSDFGMLSCVPEDGVTLPSRTVDSSSLSPLKNKVNIYSSYYEEPLVIPMTIVKNDISNRDVELKDYEFAQIKHWLESNSKPMVLRVSDCYDTFDERVEMNVNNDGDIVSVSVGSYILVDIDPEQEEKPHGDFNPLDKYSEVYYVGVFDSIQPYMVDGTCYGANIQFKCDSPYGYIDANDLYYDFSTNKSTVTLVAHNVDAGYVGCLRPIIDVNSSSTFSSGDYIIVNNQTTGESVRINLGSASRNLNIDCEKKVAIRDNIAPITISELGYNITSDIKGFISSSYVVMNWPRLINGDNVVSIEPHSSSISNVTIKYRNVCNNGGLI